MRILLSGLLLLALSSPALAQPTELRREMARASFLVGEWEGQGWMKIGRDSERIPGPATGEGRPLLSGLILGWKSVLGMERRVLLTNDVTLRFRRDSAQYRVAIHAPGHSPRDASTRVAECELSWEMRVPGSEPGAERHFRHTIRVDANNRLTETGERSDDGGRTWWQFYGAEMAGRSGDGCRASAVPEPARTGAER